MELRPASAYAPAGDQPAAIEALTQRIAGGASATVLLGVTGSGKTFTVAHTLARLGRPAVILAHNKTLAAQLYQEFKELFPDNAVEYFISYYDYYQPEAYIATTDTYIEKDSSVNEEIEKLRHAATRAVLERRDVIVVSSVSCIYGIGDPELYQSMTEYVAVGARFDRDRFLKNMIGMQYERNDIDFHRGTVRVRGDTIDVFPPHETAQAVRVAFFGDEVDSLTEFDPITGRTLRKIQRYVFYPNTHWAADRETVARACVTIREELRERLIELRSNNKLVEAQRLEERTGYDLEMLESVGWCAGIENYSRHLTGRAPGERPWTLLDYFPDDFVMVIDESHVTIPQVRAMYAGDRSRKMNLVEYGFRLPSAMDNRPMKFEEFQQKCRQVLYVSATPADYELKAAEGEVIEQVVRPTGLVDPRIEVRPVGTQVDDLLLEIRATAAKGYRTLVTTLTKKFSEHLTEFLADNGVKVRYLHSDVETLERIEILRDLRLGVFDALVGINLLREGLDLPEVQLVAVLDADKEGFLRSRTSLIQTIGRAARNLEGRVILYADRITDSMRAAMDETERRRAKQESHNAEHGITPQAIEKAVRGQIGDSVTESKAPAYTREGLLLEWGSEDEVEAEINRLRTQMETFAHDLEFEKAAAARDQMLALQEAWLKA